MQMTEAYRVEVGAAVGLFPVYALRQSSKSERDTFPSSVISASSSTVPLVNAILHDSKQVRRAGFPRHVSNPGSVGTISVGKTSGVGVGVRVGVGLEGGVGVFVGMRVGLGVGEGVSPVALSTHLDPFQQRLAKQSHP